MGTRRLGHDLERAPHKQGFPPVRVTVMTPLPRHRRHHGDGVVRCRCGRNSTDEARKRVMSDLVIQLRALWADLSAKMRDIPEHRVSVLTEAASAIEALALRAETVEQERDEARRMLGECYVISGADTDGNDWTRLWAHAVDNARETRRLHEAGDDELLAQIDALRAELAARGIPVEDHARAVQEAWLDGGGEQDSTGLAVRWWACDTRRDLIAALAAHGLTLDRAAALADGAE